MYGKQQISKDLNPGLIVSTNTIPSFSAIDGGKLRRLVLITFNSKITFNPKKSNTNTQSKFAFNKKKYEAHYITEVPLFYI